MTDIPADNRILCYPLCLSGISKNKVRIIYFWELQSRIPTKCQRHYQLPAVGARAAETRQENTVWIIGEHERFTVQKLQSRYQYSKRRPVCVCVSVAVITHQKINWAAWNIGSSSSTITKCVIPNMIKTGPRDITSCILGKFMSVVKEI